MTYTRKNVTRLTRTERRRFVDAVLELKRSGEYDDFVRIHIEYFVADGDTGLRAAHMTPSFLPWHRILLLEFEKALRRIDESVTVPYWDWTKNRGTRTTPWTADLLGGTGRGSDRRVTSGPFSVDAGWILEETVTDADFLMRDLGRPSRPISLPTARDVEWALAEPVYDRSPWNSLSSGFRNKLEGWGPGDGSASWLNHNRVHRWIGGTMVGGASVNDPAFWLHHAFVDLQWTRWQRRHPRSHYLPEHPPGRDDRNYGRIIARHERMPPWDLTPAETENVGRVYRYA